MPVVNLGSAWIELDITNGWLQNRSAATIECTNAVSPEQIAYGLLAPGESISYADWLIGTIFVRKSQTSSAAKAVLVCNANTTNEFAAIQNNLFLQDDIGVFFDPVKSALYTDAAGTTPAVVGDPVAHQQNVSGVAGMPNATQATTALCPTLRQTSSSNRRWLEAVDSDDALNIVFASAPGTMYVGRFTSEGVEWTTESWGTTVNTIRRWRYNGGLIARNRNWTAAEKALIESYRARYLPTLGPELVVNGSLDTDVSGWTAGALATLEWVSGRMRGTQPPLGSATSARQAIALQEITHSPGIFQFRATPYEVPSLPASSSPTIRRASAEPGSFVAYIPYGSVATLVFISGVSNSTISVGNVLTNTVGSIEYDNISFREIS